MSKRASAKKNPAAGVDLLNSQDDLTTPAASAAVARTKRPATRSKAPATTAAAEEKNGQKRQRTEKPPAVAAEECDWGVQPDTPATLFEDGLHIVFSFLDDREFIKNQPWLVGHHWNAAAVSMPSRRMLTTIRTPDQVTLLGASPLALRHVTRLTLKRPHGSDEVIIAEGDALLAAACTGPLRDQLTEIIFTQWCSNPDRDQPLNFAPLLKLPNLDTLELRSHDLTAPQQKVIKQLASLRKLTHTNESEECDLSDLLAPPHSLHQLIDLESSLTAEDVQLVVDQLPQLTRLVSVCIDPESVPLLSGLTHLRDVTLEFYEESAIYREHFREVDPDVDDDGWDGESRESITEIFPDGLPFGQVRKLSLKAFFRIDSDLRWFLHKMPFLEDLSLNRIEMRDLKAFKTSANQLRSLELIDCRHITFEMLDDLAACPLLTSLRVQLVPHEPRLYRHHVEELRARLPKILCIAVLCVDFVVVRG